MLEETKLAPDGLFSLTGFEGDLTLVVFGSKILYGVFGFTAEVLLEIGRFADGVRS